MKAEARGLEEAQEHPDGTTWEYFPHHAPLRASRQPVDGACERVPHDPHWRDLTLVHEPATPIAPSAE